MKIAIHHRPGSYSDGWIAYCQENSIDYKIVNAYDTDIIKQVEDCDAFMWHHHHGNGKDIQFAKQLLYSLEQSGIKTFPDFNTGWHFDDKLGQKYLFEALDIPIASSYAFYDKETAVNWANGTSYPKVFKLRGGAGSANVMLARNSSEAIKYINKSFKSGWKPFSGFRYFFDKIKIYKGGKASLFELLKAFGRIFIYPRNTKFLPTQIGYVYFQDFIENDGFDYRIEVCGDKCIALIRKCRKGDFRASGGHNNIFDKENIQADVIKLAFDIADKMHSQSCALDFVRDKNTNNLYLVENSYCYGVDSDEFSHGYWDRDAVWHDEKFNGLYWMVENLINYCKNEINIF